MEGALLAGLVAGLGVAMPLGAIGVLLVQEGILRGWRPAAAGATGVALVDLAYAAAAVAAGTLVSRALAGHEQPVRRAGAVVLLLVAAHGLLALRRTAGGPATSLPPGAVTLPDGTALGPDGAPDATAAGSPARVLGRFAGLTLINPLTAIYFVVLTAGLGDQVAGTARATMFVAGVFAASLAWQLTLAGSAALAGRRLPAWARTATTVAGHLLVAGYAVRLALA